jgi:hypothetical protein
MCTHFEMKHHPKTTCVTLWMIALANLELPYSTIEQIYHNFLLCFTILGVIAPCDV